jgi:hypothetical protein
MPGTRLCRRTAQLCLNGATIFHGNAAHHILLNAASQHGSRRPRSVILSSDKAMNVFPGRQDFDISPACVKQVWALLASSNRCNLMRLNSISLAGGGDYVFVPFPCGKQPEMRSDMWEGVNNV